MIGAPSATESRQDVPLGDQKFISLEMVDRFLEVKVNIFEN
jgi:hypothetical protein